MLGSFSAPTGGSSPRERGTVGDGDGDGPVQRFIPARAGNSGSTACPFRRQSVHPRASGEQAMRSPHSASASGSSPRERGAGVAWRRARSTPGFIPARAGNRRSARHRSAPPTVHPRASGEQACPMYRFPYSAGSSPRERGTATAGCENAALRRFIPARAGNRSSTAPIIWTHPVHPRASGEQPPQMHCHLSQPGSSPRERGTGERRKPAVLEQRFIPARAGNRPLCSMGRRSAPVHPRASGEQAGLS